MQTCWRSDKVDFCEINKRNASMQRSTISMFAQLVQLMGGKIEFQNLVNKYQSDKGAKGLTTWSQFIAMLFCQLTGADSLREISDGLYSSFGKLSHLGATAVCRSTLSYANSKRPYKLYGTFIKFSLRNSDTRYKGASETNSPNGLQLRFRNNKLMPSSV